MKTRVKKLMDVKERNFRWGRSVVSLVKDQREERGCKFCCNTHTHLQYEHNVNVKLVCVTVQNFEISSFDFFCHIFC